MFRICRIEGCGKGALSRNWISKGIKKSSIAHFRFAVNLIMTARLSTKSQTRVSRLQSLAILFISFSLAFEVNTS